MLSYKFAKKINFVKQHHLWAWHRRSFSPQMKKVQLLQSCSFGTSYDLFSDHEEDKVLWIDCSIGTTRKQSI